MPDYAPYGTEGDPGVLVIGAMAVDAKGRPHETLVPGTSTPGIVHLTVGGVGRNIADNLARLGVCTTLLSAVGDDPIGRIVLDATAHSGVDVEQVVVSAQHRTATYIAVTDRNGVKAHAIDDMAIVEVLTPSLIYRKRRLLRDAAMIVIDANLTPKTMEMVFRLAQKYDRPVCVDATSAILAPRLRPHLANIFLILPSLNEAESLVDPQLQDRGDAQGLALKLVNMGVEIAIITLSEIGLYYASSDESGHVPALRRDIVDLTGAAEALAATVVFGLLNDFTLSEAVRLGVSAAALTGQCTETVCPDLSLDRLYDELVI